MLLSISGHVCHLMCSMKYRCKVWLNSHKGSFGTDFDQKGNHIIMNLLLNLMDSELRLDLDPREGVKTSDATEDSAYAHRTSLHHGQYEVNHPGSATIPADSIHGRKGMALRIYFQSSTLIHTHMTIYCTRASSPILPRTHVL